MSRAKPAEDISAIQARIDAINWYHEFDLGGGLRTRSQMADVEVHRAIWQFIERNLDGVDFHGKTVLDVGCWDGYWSFYAERRGARSVLATDDQSQNWGEASGILLAKELLGSSVEVNLNVSAYDLSSLGRKFDVVMFLGVFYHLFDPFYALAQIRHCCHPGTLLLVEGSEAAALSPSTALYNFTDHSCEWLPTRGVLEQLLKATYFDVVAAEAAPTWDDHPGLPGRRWRGQLAVEALLRDSREGVRRMVRGLEPAARRVFLTCKPFEGENEVHAYRPPFGLHSYDARFKI